MLQWIYLAAVVLGCAAVCAAGYFVTRRAARRSGAARLTSVFLFFALISVLLEVFAFNWKYFLTKNYEPIGIDSEYCLADVGSTDDMQMIMYAFDDPGREVNNFYIKVGTHYDSSKDDAVCQRKYAKYYTGDDEEVNVDITVIDKSNDVGKALKTRKVVGSVDRCNYIMMDLSGGVTGVTVVLSCSEEYLSPVIIDCAVNAPVPMMFSIGRVLVIFALLSLIYIFRPKSSVYSHSVGTNRLREGLLTAASAVLAFACVTGIVFVNGAQMNTVVPQHAQYDQLARSLAQGRTDIGDAPEFLSELDDPYDRDARDAAAKKLDTTYQWDTAYRNGKYYVYFGVVPCVLTFLPYYLITGKDLNNVAAFLIFAAVFTAAVFLLTRLLAKKLCPRLPFALLMLLSFTVVVSSVMVIAKHADLYAMPIMSGLACAVSGVLLWYFALTRAKDRLPAAALFFGSLGMALVVGCRPQMFLFVLIALPLFWKEVFKSRRLFSKKSIAGTTCFVLPFFIVAALQMFYNFTRFGSPFDFGANYNLTTNDMTVRGIRVGRLGSAFFSYFVEPPRLSVLFPFIDSSDISGDSLYMGTRIYTKMYGSVFLCFVILLFLFCLFRRKQRTLARKNGILIPVLICVVSSVVIALTDAQMAGILWRYTDDFVFALMLSAFLVILVLYADAQKDGGALPMRSLVLTAVAITLLADAALTCVDDDNSMHDHYASLYYNIMYLVSFWL